MRESKVYSNIRATLCGAAFSISLIGLASLAPQSSPAQELTDPETALQRLTDTDPQSREKAARDLGRSTPPKEETISALARLVNANDEESVKRSAVEALASTASIAKEKGQAKEIVSLLTRAFSARQPASVRAAIVRGLAMVSLNKDSQVRTAATPGALALLVEALTKPDPDPIVRADAASALGMLSETIQTVSEEDKQKTVNALIHTIQVGTRNISENAAQSLKQMPKIAVPALINELQNSNNDANFKWTLAWMLATISDAAKDQAKDILPVVTAIFSDKTQDANLRGAAVWTVGMLGPDTTADGTAKFRERVSTLTKILKDRNDDPNPRSNAAWALGRIGREKIESVGSKLLPDIISTLTGGLKDPDHNIRRNCAWSLGQIHESDRSTVAELGTTLDTDVDMSVRTQAAVALGFIGQAAHTADPAMAAVEHLRRVLPNSDPAIRVAAAESLGEIGVAAIPAIPNLVAALHGSDHARNKTHQPPETAAARALIAISNALKERDETAEVSELSDVRDKLKENNFREEADDVKRDIQDLEDKKAQNQRQGFTNWIKQHMLILGLTSGYIVFWFLLYWKFPLTVFRINDALQPYIGVKLPEFLGGMPVSYFVLGGFFFYRPRVLDAWVLQHSTVARANFDKKLTVEQRSVHVDLPVVLDDKALSALTAADLRPHFKKNRTCLIVCGEGGVGKTSLACQLCRWAMAEDNETVRLTDHPILPVLLEQVDLDADGNDVLIDKVRSELWYLTGGPEAPSSELVEKLMQYRRILVVVDGLSEMNKDNRSKLLQTSTVFSARALVITSRREERIGGTDLTVIRPMRIKGDYLSSFMEAYLTKRNKKELFSDSEYFYCLGRFSRIVGEREVTALLAKLYGEHMISTKENPSIKLPENVPELMLEYLNELNRNAWQGRIEDRVVHKVAKIIAWECLRETFRPRPADVDTVIQRLGGEKTAIDERLKYLEGNLRLIQTIGAARDRIRFTLDPLAEYLAALQALEDAGGDEKNWRELLSATSNADRDGFEPTKGFWRALRDCCAAQKSGIRLPEFVLNELDRRTGDSPSNPNVLANSA